MKITQESILSVIEQTQTKKKSKPESIEEQVTRDVSVAKSISRSMDKKFLITKPITRLDFVEKKIFDDFFESGGNDMEAIRLSSIKLNDKIKSSKVELRQKYDNLLLQINNTSSIIDWVALYNSVAFSNISVLKEDFSSEQDIVQSASPLSVDIFDGMLSLGIDSITPISLKGSSVGFNDNSNGYISSGDLSRVIDGSDQSYMKYEQVSSADSLILDFTLNMDRSEVINQIVVNPNDFMTQNWIEILDIKTSVNGKDYHSINDANAFYRSSLFQDDTSSGSIILRPDKNGGIKTFTLNFQPIRAKYIRFTFKQDSLHPISDKYIIGINDIAINNVSYSAFGSLTVKKEVDIKSIDSLSIDVDTISKSDSQVLPVSYKISFDNSTWYDIQPVKSFGSKKEILNFNQDWLADSIDTTSFTGKYVYVKIDMARVIDPSSIETILSNYKINTSKVVDFPTVSPYSIPLDNVPLDDSVKVFSMPYISAGIPGLNSISIGKTSPGVSSYEIKIPFDPLGLERIQIGETVVPKYNNVNDIGDLIDGNALGYFIDSNTININIPDNPIPRDGRIEEPWLVNSGANSAATVASNTNNEITDLNGKPIIDTPNITIDSNHNKIIAGDILRGNKDIKMIMSSEVLSLNRRTFSLKHHCDGIADNVKITRVKFDSNGNILVTNVSDIIAAGQTKIKLSASPYDVKTATILGGYVVDFIDGFHEFLKEQEFTFSIDVDNNMLYLRDAYTQNVHIDYSSQSAFTLKSSDFEIKEDSKTITIREWAFDASSSYIVNYNIAVEVPSSYYSVNNINPSVDMTDKSIVDGVYSQSAFAEKKLKVVYSFRESIGNVISEISDGLSPAIGNLSILFSTDSL